MLKEIIDKFYLDRQKDKTQTHFYISEAGKCPRQIFFKFKNVSRKEMEPHILRLFDHGDHMHQLIMKSLLSTRDIHVVASEVNIPPQQLVSGRADAIISNGKDLYILDIKSMNSMIFRTLTEPKEENIKQIQLYSYYFNIPRGILLYVNKDNLQLKEFIIEYNPIEAERLIENLTFLKKQIDSNIVPARIPDYPDDWQCRYCQFRGVCDLGDPDQMDWKDFKTKINTL
ncbi:MAG: PD-(D/E)XK nuclease family protein [bacterium]|nr:PD-(D/E)XK nuclease family protein [bacterium]